MDPLSVHLSPSPDTPGLLRLSYLGDRPAEPRKDGGPKRPRPFLRPAGVNLSSPLPAQLCQPPWGTPPTSPPDPVP